MRYFIEVSYKGNNYAGFQIQLNAPTIQGEVERALGTFYRSTINLTGSSRTDAGVHARQNFFHFDFSDTIATSVVYNLNSILPPDISIQTISQVKDDAHARFDAISREYYYCIYNYKNPFLKDTGWFYPYPLDIELLNKAAAIIKAESDFNYFSKKNSQVKTTVCNIFYSHWNSADGNILYTVKANRFLRGMVRALVATMLKVGRHNISLSSFESIFKNNQSKIVDFSAPSFGLFLNKVEYPPEIFEV